jgi:large subunit ribosomal protein L3
LGVERTTVQHLEVVGVQADQELLLIRGAVPGPKNSLVYISETSKYVKFRATHVDDKKAAGKAAKKEAPKSAAPAAKPAAKGGK